MTFLGIDLGTSSVKVAVADAAGRVTTVARREYPVDSPRAGWAQTAPSLWRTAVIDAVQETVTASGQPVTAIGLSGQMHGLVLAGADGEPVQDALLWPDSRAAGELSAYRLLPASALSDLANPLTPGMAGPMLRWIARHSPAVLEATTWALQPKDWLRLWLTGEVAAEPSDGSATLLWSAPDDTWAFDVVDALGIPADLLPPVVPSGSIAGGLTAAAAAALGLPEGLPVAAGASDGAAAALGSGLSRPGDLQLTVGTGGQVTTPVTGLPPRGRSTHLFRTAQSSGRYSLAATLNAGLALSWVVKVLGASWDELYGQANRPVRGRDPLFLPYLTGERTPYLDESLRGTWAGLSLSHDRDDLLRAALEGVAFSLRAAMAALPGVVADVPIRMAGGGTAAPAWRQLLADVLQHPLHQLDEPDASARGACLIAAVATGTITQADALGPLAPVPVPAAEPSPDQSVRTILDERYARYQRQVAASQH